MTPPPNTSAADAYLAASVESAPPIKIVRMLYQGALRFLAQAEAEDPTQPSSRFVEHCSSADAIVSELRMSLDREQDAGEITDNLEQLYLFCERSLHQAMLERSAAPIAGTKAVLQRLLDAWQQIEVQAMGSQAA